MDKYAISFHPFLLPKAFYSVDRMTHIENQNTERFLRDSDPLITKPIDNNQK